MSQLAANTPPNYAEGLFDSAPVKASAEIFLGSAVGLTSGYARQLNSGDIFVGFAEQHINNTAATDGALNVPIRIKGFIVAAISGVAVTDVGKPVYMSDGATFTLTASTNTRIGTVIRYLASGSALIAFDGTQSTQVIAAITDSTGGTPSTTFAAITAGGSYAQADMVAVKNALSQIAADLNALKSAGL